MDKWKGDESGHSSRLKLWLRGSEPLNPPALQGVCSHCGNQYNDRSITIRKHSESENEWYSIFSETARFPWRTEVTTACIKDKSTSENDFCSEECAAAFHGLDLFEIDARRRANDEFGRALLGIDGYIYRIWNKANGKSYVGKTNRDFLQRWKEHFGLTYTNPIFRDDLKAHGMESFAFEILEAIGGEPLKAFIEERKAVGHLDYSNERSLCEVYTLNREQFWIDRFDSVKSGYNQRDNFRR